eukprot:7118549-Prymnesium_polylepis.1
MSQTRGRGALPGVRGRHPGMAIGGSSRAGGWEESTLTRGRKKRCSVERPARHPADPRPVWYATFS